MANKKYHYYVLVFTNNGPVYVTSLNRENKYAHWNKDEEPMEFSSTYAEDLVIGLNANFHNAVLIKSRIEIDTQPYRYADFDCTFVRKEEK